MANYLQEHFGASSEFQPDNSIEEQYISQQGEIILPIFPHNHHVLRNVHSYVHDYSHSSVL